ncbi:MAG: exodeoxyribonuclease I [Enterovibrio sp.]
MPSPTFYFFDYETFGVHPGADRPCQFAGVRTDSELNIIDSSWQLLYCKPPADYLPNPHACLITGISPQTALQNGIAEPEFIQAIHEQLAVPNTCAIGYNNIRFDDEVTRFTLYRNFFEPYGWSWQNGNSRWDLLDVMRAAYALRPDGLNWPLTEEGLPSFKLEQLSVQNGIEHSNAHDAKADVIATIELAKKLKQAQPRLFNYLFEHRNKNKLKALIDCENMQPLVYVSGLLGRQNGCTTLVAPIAWHPSNANAVITVDLAKDLTPLLTLDAKTLQARLYTKRDELAMQGLAPVPLQQVTLNQCPVLAPAKVLDAACAARLGIDIAACLANLAKLRAALGVTQKVEAIFQTQREFLGNDNVDCALYDGFFSYDDQRIMQKIRQTEPAALSSISLQHADPRLAELLFNYRGRHFSHTLSASERQLWHARCQRYFAEHLPTYQHEFAALLEQHRDNKKNLLLLKEISQYVDALTEPYQASIPA